MFPIGEKDFSPNVYFKQFLGLRDLEFGVQGNNPPNPRELWRCETMGPSWGPCIEGHSASIHKLELSIIFGKAFDGKPAPE